MTDDRIAAIRERCDKIEGDAWGNADGYDPDLANVMVCVREIRKFLTMLDERDTEIDRLTAELLQITQHLAVKSKALESAFDLSDDAGDIMESLLLKLAASQRREQAAIADMKAMADEPYEDEDVCKFCKHGDCVCCDDKPEDCFEWRGPQEGGE